MPPTKKADYGFIPNRFADQVALVVGGAHGIGKAISVRLGLEGASVMIADVDAGALQSTAGEIARQAGTVDTVVCDVRKEAQVKRMVSRVIRQYGRIDVLMPIAGVAKPVPFLKDDHGRLRLDARHQRQGLLLCGALCPAAHGQAAARKAGLHGLHEQLGRGTGTGALQHFEGGRLPRQDDRQKIRAVRN